MHRYIPLAVIGMLAGSCEQRTSNLEQRAIEEEQVQETQENVQEIHEGYAVEQMVQPVQQHQRNYRTTDFSQDTNEMLLARMIYGEARGCSPQERIAVGFTAVNRAARGRWYGGNLREVILRPHQYSCFNRNDPNRTQLMDPQQYDEQAFEECLDVARGIISGNYEDPTQGATHYFNPRAANPSWANRLTRIGRINNSRHVFYREE